MIKKIFRFFLLLMIFMIIAAAIVGYARFIEPELLTVRTFTVKTEKPIKDCKVVFFTDTHFGKLYSENHAAKLADKINALNPDIVLFGGDLLDNYARDRAELDMELLRDQLGRIEASSGKYAVWGNHDYGGGAVRIYEDFMASCGFQVLDDESRTFEDLGIRLIGYDDYLMGYTDPSLYTIKSDFFNIIVAHEPVISQAVKSHSDNFMFTGHTHGGQIGIPFLASKVIPYGSGKFVKGFYDAEEIGTESSLSMYTSSGIGMTKYPFRFLNVPEIIEVQFQSER